MFHLRTNINEPNYARYEGNQQDASQKFDSDDGFGNYELYTDLVIVLQWVEDFNVLDLFGSLSIEYHLDLTVYERCGQVFGCLSDTSQF